MRVWEQQQWETKANGRVSNSTYGKVVSQSHCCATLGEYEWAKSRSPHFTIFSFLCARLKREEDNSYRIGREERRIRKKCKNRATISCLYKPRLKYKYNFLYHVRKIRNMHLSGNYFCAISHDIIEKIHRRSFVQLSVF